MWDSGKVQWYVGQTYAIGAHRQIIATAIVIGAYGKKTMILNESTIQSIHTNNIQLVHVLNINVAMNDSSCSSCDIVNSNKQQVRI